jgi:hypothetical protein
VTAPDAKPLPGQPDLEGARKRFPAAEFAELNPGYRAKLPDGRVLVAQSVEGLESKLRVATGQGKRR